MSSSMFRMKHLLSTGEHSDVHFLVGDGDAKEVLPAHQLILKSASDVFEAMFRFDAKKERPENVSGNCPDVVEIPDIEAAAFKVMLSFIYADDLSDLNGDNAMAVLYAAKKYNIPGLIRPSLQIPISELRNVFFAYAQALLFDLEDFSIKCLRYICQNAADLFGSDEFLQIDQKMLCNLLDRDRLLLSNEFEIWKSALRWADEKCRQNGIECSSANRRSVLGPALFKIRFPNIHEKDFAKCVVPSGVLSMEELLGVYQFNSHPFLYLRGVPGLYSLKFPSHGRIFNWNKARGNRRGTLSMEIEKMPEFAGESVRSRHPMEIELSEALYPMEIEKVSAFAREIIGSQRKSETVYIGGLPWKIWARINLNPKIGSTNKNEKWLGFYLWCDAPKEENWSCKCSATLRIVSLKSGVDDFKNELNYYVFDNKENGLGYNFISIAELMDPSNGLYDQSEDKVTLAIDVTVKEAKTEDET